MLDKTFHTFFWISPLKKKEFIIEGNIFHSGRHFQILLLQFIRQAKKINSALRLKREFSAELSREKCARFSYVDDLHNKTVHKECILHHRRCCRVRVGGRKMLRSTRYDKRYLNRWKKNCLMIRKLRKYQKKSKLTFLPFFALLSPS